jgi:cytosine/uracil/thiamine/allantoin permease
VYGRRLRFVYAVVGWLLASLLALATLSALDPVAFYVLALAGFLVLAEALTPSNRLARWQGRLRWVAVFGLIGFALVAAGRIAATLPPGAF